MEEKELSHFYSDNELTELGVSGRMIKMENYIKVDAFIDDTGDFDFAFFGYTPDEAKIMNPQTRLFHQHVWSAIEDAGCNINNYNKKIGVYAGANNDINWSVYSAMNPHKNVDAFYQSKLSNPNYMSSLVAYNLNLRGPCYFSDTACSTSLTASHMACRSLLMNECSMAIAGGVKLFSTKSRGYIHHDGTIMSKDGSCRAFDIDSSGIIGGEGVGVVVMKRLNEAIEDGDNIYAVIKGSAINNDGNRKAGYTMPSVEGQVECIKMAHRIANITADSVTYIEAHGTGTAIGDPIEVEALNKAFNNNLNKNCAIGSVKTNMGHLDEAAGIAGLIKTTMALHKKELPANIHFKKPNPLINFSEGPFYVNNKSKKWQNELDTPLRAGINSFGVGGTNVHMVLEEAPVLESSNLNMKSHSLLYFSAKSDEALERYRNNLLDFLKKSDTVNFADFIYTLQTGRKHLDYRGFIVCKDRNEAIDKLFNEDLVKDKLENDKQIVFMFSGQGSQYLSMGKQLYEEEPTFRNIMDKGFDFLLEHSKEDYRKILFGNSEEDKNKINNTKYTQPLLFLFEYALAKQLMAYGIKPEYMIGHSLGEYAAACISNVFTFEEGLRLISRRADLMSKVPHGSMLSIHQSYDTFDHDILKQTSVAAINSSSSFVVSGTKEIIESHKKKLDKKNITSIILKTSHAFHSEMMNEIVDEYLNELNLVNFSKPSIPFISNVTGNLIEVNEVTSPKYWIKHLLQTVEFHKGINNLLKLNKFVFIEIGPGNTLATLCRQSAKNLKQNHVIVNSVRHIKKNVNDYEHLLSTFGILWNNGIEINWEIYYGNIKRRKLSIPTYPFESYSFPFKVDPYNALNGKGHLITEHKREVSEWFYLPGWKQTFLQETKPLTVKKENYIMFSNADDFSHLLKEKLIKEGKNVIEVIQGNHFKINDSSQIEINTNISEDYDLLEEHLRTTKFEIDVLLYNWSIASNTFINEKNHYDKDIFDSSANVKNILIIVKTLNIVDSETRKKIVYFSSNELNIVNTYNLSTETAASYSLLNVLAQENTNVFSSFIDFDETSVNDNLISSVYKEIIHNESDTKVSYRNNKRWSTSYNNISIENIDELDTNLLSELNVLITGGLGYVGFILAEYLMKTYNATILLTGRKSLSNVSAEALKRLHTLETYGSVAYSKCDVSDFDLLSKEIDQWQNEHGNITGIIHAAGNTDITSYKTIYKTDKASFNNQFDSKGKGILNLYEIFKEQDMKFVRAISSLSTILGGLTYGAYSAANHFMDTFILSRANDLKNWMTINFDGIVSTDDRYINGEELVSVFEKSLFMNVNQILISVRDFDSAIEEINKSIKEENNNDEFKIERPKLSIGYAEAITETEKVLAKMWEGLFGIDSIGINDDFFELGGDSLKGIRTLQSIEKKFDVSLSVQELFTNSTVFKIAKLIDQKKWLSEESTGMNELSI
ncbi:JamP [Nonlabens dokdonensis DSW-6]|uniref:JamP n=2 Tax=Nonlabens dokdonensis TaxID=328515 RepID=L7W5D8_NONDD|nr:JamP [Nonlabens dokdonensis DSW-6]